MEDSQSSEVSESRAEARRRREASFGKIRATRVRRSSSWLTRSMALLVRRRRWWADGKAKTAKPSGMALSSQRKLYAYIHTLVDDSTAAWDVLQETNVVLWRKQAEFRKRHP